MNNEIEKKWYGKSPKEWKYNKIGVLYQIRNQKVSDTEYEPLSVGKMGVVKQLEDVAKSDAHDDRKLVLKGDFVINSRSDRRNACGVSEFDGSVSLINIVITPREEMDMRYYNWLYYTNEFADEFYKWGHGIVDDLWTTNYQDMKNIEVPMPEKKEQQRIADFLDSKCQKIDDTIEKINKQIEVLKKYKQSLVTEVVTKGLDKNAPMKDSGVEWIGKIPKRWEVKRLKYTINSIVKGNGITKEEVIEDGDTPCVRYGELYTKYNHSFDKCVSYTNKDIIEIKQYFYKDSILFTCTGELIEEIGKSIVYKGNEECLAGGDILVVATSENAEFINYVSNSYAQIQKSIGKAKLKVVHISAFDISNLLIAIPIIDEQNKIVEYLDSKCSKIDNILDKKTKQIEILERYKKSLIYEYVTGKKRVA